ncbi:CREB-regulated transcription coactivator 1 isoform X5 [Vespula maculifrons]|uniref:CREB-regulated transcription coactivator 1 isoform X5 n=1 Tax=Vespula maculifrons TaxID=7453 RepID=A0ABD2AWL2_VESMC
MSFISREKYLKRKKKAIQEWKDESFLKVASASSSVGASPTGSGVPDAPLSVKSAGASPPQSSGKHLHINLGNQFRAGGSLPNVNNNANCANDTKEHHPSQHTGAVHSIDLKKEIRVEKSNNFIGLEILIEQMICFRRMGCSHFFSFVFMAVRDGIILFVRYKNIKKGDIEENNK